MTAQQSPRQRSGAQGEAVAADHLARHGLAVLTRNFRVKGGEIDLICQDGDSVVFVEVRVRASAAFGGAGASITAQKQARLALAAQHWLARHGEQACRFDCVLIDGGRLEWIRNAFDAA
jgi:putative endonuclease